MVAHQSIYITTPIYYVNDAPHLGHAYTTVLADTFARYHRSRGRAVFFLTGTDEHGQKIEEVARAAATTPLAHADRVVERFRDTWKRLLIANDDFIRTTEPRHKAVVERFWQRLVDRGDIYLSSYEGWYCVACEDFSPESQVVDGMCPIHQRSLSRIEEPSYFFRMSRYERTLIEHIESHPAFIQPESRRNEVLAFVKGGLRDLSISRTSFSWGIPVPGDPAHVIYVWVDALVNYLSALGGTEGPNADTFWPHAVHLVGKDIVRFHCVYWPTLLMAAGVPLPKTVLAHGWWTVRGKKISKSMPATRVDPNLLAEDLSPDALRYFLLREVPLGLDGDFSYEALLSRTNSELGNDLGNLVNRTLTLAHRFLAGRVPSPGHPSELAAIAVAARDQAAAALEAYHPSRALDAIFELVRAANRYVDHTAPWTMAKDPDRAALLPTTLYELLETIGWLGRLLVPFMPAKGAAMLAQLGVDVLAESTLPAWPDRWGELPAGQSLGTPAPLFPKIDAAKSAELLNRWVAPELREDSSAPTGGAPSAAPPKADAAASLTFDEVQRLDLRTGRIEHAERIAGSTRLLRLEVDLGEGRRRQIVSGIAETYAPEQLLGRTVVVVANLAPANIRGTLSEGMLLAAGEAAVEALATVDGPVAPGTRVR
jgi:methionyl-tRNA synthetase